MRRCLQLAAFLTALLCCSHAAAQTIDTLALRAHTRVLAHDSMQGRRTGTAGGSAAVRYIAEQLRTLGLQPFDSAYTQPVPLRQVSIADATSLLIGNGSQSARFSLYRDFVVATGGRGALRSVAGQAFYAGTVANAVRIQDWDEMRGRIIVLLGSLGDDAGRLARAWQRSGVSGVILLVPDARNFESIARTIPERRLYVDAPVDEPHWQPELPVIHGGPDLALSLLRDARVPAITDTALIAPIDLARSVSLDIHANTREVVTHNVAGIITGADPSLRDEVVIFTAHWDHLGIREPVAGDSIYNGFSDNAAGVAMLLAIAQALHASPPARSVLFLFPAAEEEGLLGSAYYAARPLVPLAKTAAVINLDAGAPPVPPVSWRFAGDPTSRLSALAGQVAHEHGWTADIGPARANSDHWPFLARGVPAVFVVPGNRWENVSDAQRDELRRRWDRYHHPADHWFDDFPFAGLARYAALALEIGMRAAVPDFR
jgi:hypothetical protein